MDEIWHIVEILDKKLSCVCQYFLDRKNVAEFCCKCQSYRKKSKVALGQICTERVVERGTVTKMWLVQVNYKSLD